MICLFYFGKRLYLKGVYRTSSTLPFVTLSVPQPVLNYLGTVYYFFLIILDSGFEGVLSNRPCPWSVRWSVSL